MQKLRYRHAIWDWNGTLLNDTWLCIHVLNSMLEKRGRAGLTESDYKLNFGFPVVHFYKYLGFDTDTDSFEKISREFIDTYEAQWLNKCHLHDDTKSTLTQLIELGMSHSVLSAAKQEALEIGIQHYALDQHFIQLIGADNIYANGKVQKGLEWIKQLSWDPSEVVMVGDTLHDYEVAQAIGVDCVLMTHGHHCSTRFQGTDAIIAHSLQELNQIFSSAQTA